MPPLDRFGIAFKLGSRFFLLPVEAIQEVTEDLALKTFPPLSSAIQGYIGMVSLRGIVLPVLGDTQWPRRRLLIVKDEKCETFALPVHSVKKVLLSQFTELDTPEASQATSFEQDGSSRVLNLDGEPLIPTTPQKLFASLTTQEAA